MLDKNNFNLNRAKEIIKAYERGEGAPEQISEKYRYDMFETFTIIFNYRGCGKNSKELTDENYKELYMTSVFDGKRIDNKEKELR